MANLSRSHARRQTREVYEAGLLGLFAAHERTGQEVVRQRRPGEQFALVELAIVRTRFGRSVAGSASTAGVLRLICVAGGCSFFRVDALVLGLESGEAVVDLLLVLDG